jgi:hypothetical protein
MASGDVVFENDDFEVESVSQMVVGATGWTARFKEYDTGSTLQVVRTSGTALGVQGSGKKYKITITEV